jgi:Family of unknown function (DUF5681)
VGFRKPPVASRFKQGQSGNPKGRPKGARNKLPPLNAERLKTIILEEAYRTIKVNEGGRQITIPMAQAVVRALTVNGARGQVRSGQIFTALLSEVERDNKTASDEWFKTAVEYKVDWERELDRRAKLGIIEPEPIPHPDDIVLDMRTCQVIVNGPMTKEEKVKWDRMYDRIEASDRAIAELTEDLKLPKNKRYLRFIEDEIAHEKRIRQILVNGVGEPKRRNRGDK